MNIDSFIEAFRDKAGSEEAICECGRVHEDASYMTFEGREYVINCPCWEKRAKQIIAFLDAHSHKIVDYYKLEKKRKQKEAENAPTLDEQA
jgi:hypothetical protein